jgi:thiol-disulfide isomerase/thioredoxin
MRRIDEDGRMRSLAGRWLAGIALVLVACGGGNDTTANADAPEAGSAAAAKDDRMAAPAWELPDLDGNPVRSESFAGKTLVVDFWATWCPPCIFQIPVLNAIQTKHRDHGVVVIGVAVDVEGAKIVKPYAEENGIEYTIVIGDEGLARKFGAPGFPALAIVSPDGKIDSMHVGLLEEGELDAAIAKGQGS